MELQLRGLPAGLGRRCARASAHAGEPRGLGRRQALDAAQRLARSARADRSDAARCIRAAATRGSPIDAVVLTGAEIDQTAGLLSLRERSPFTLMRDCGNACRSRRQSDVRRAAADVVTPPRDRARRTLRARRRPAGRAVPGAGQGAALSRGRKSRHRGARPRPMSASRSPTATRGSPTCRAPPP